MDLVRGGQPVGLLRQRLDVVVVEGPHAGDDVVRLEVLLRGELDPVLVLVRDFGEEGATTDQRAGDDLTRQRQDDRNFELRAVRELDEQLECRVFRHPWPLSDGPPIPRSTSGYAIGAGRARLVRAPGRD